MPSTSETAPAPTDLERVEYVLCDLDGVVWLARRALPGAADAVARLRAGGRRVLFVTNNSMSTIGEQEAALDAIGVPAVDDVVTSAQAAATLVAPDERVLVCGGVGVREAIEARGASIVADGEHDERTDAVVVGLHQDFDYWRLQAANRAIRDGARFIATNDDATFPTPDGPIPGGGALVAAVATASATAPTIAGKPHAPMAQLVGDRCGPGFDASRAVMVGDRFSTDGEFARAIGCPFVLVRTGVTRPGEAVGGAPTIDLPDIAALADLVCARD